MNLESDISFGMKKRNGFVLNAVKLFVFISQHAFLVGINGIKKEQHNKAFTAECKKSRTLKSSVTYSWKKLMNDSFNCTMRSINQTALKADYKYDQEIVN